MECFDCTILNLFSDEMAINFNVLSSFMVHWVGYNIQSCPVAFEELKKYLSSLPLLSPSKPGEELYLYLAISQAAVSVALVRKEDGCRKPVYFISQAFQGVEERYPQMEKLAFALVTTARKLKPYFQAHTIIVLIDQPLRRAIISPKVAKRMALWAIEISEFDLQYRPQTAIKGQAMADFITKFAQSEGKEVGATTQWSIHMDESSNRQAGGAGVAIQTPKGDKIECMI